MAYEHMTYEYILKNMLDRVATQYPNLDTREGSILFNALAPAALELALMYIELDNVLNESFVDTASREYLLLACKQVGMDTSMFDATCAVHKAHFSTNDIPIGSRWNHNEYNYVVTGYIGWQNSQHTYAVQCETPGVNLVYMGVDNVPITYELTPITDIPTDVTYARLVACSIEAEDEATDDEIRTAYYEYIKSTVTDGNVAQYERWCSEYDGIGNYKIIPQWNGANTVKVSILTPTNKIADDSLIKAFQKYLDPDSKGMGEGKAPIGSFVTVNTASPVQISMSAVVTMKPGYTKDKVTIDNAIKEYLAEVAYKRDVIPYMSIGAVILNVEGVDRVDDLVITKVGDGQVYNIELADEEIATLGITNWG